MAHRLMLDLPDKTFAALARFAAEEVLRGTAVDLHLAHQRQPLALSVSTD